MSPSHYRHCPHCKQKLDPWAVEPYCSFNCEIEKHESIQKNTPPNNTKRKMTPTEKEWIDDICRKVRNKEYYDPIPIIYYINDPENIYFKKELLKKIKKIKGLK